MERSVYVVFLACVLNRHNIPCDWVLHVKMGICRYVLLPCSVCLPSGLHGLVGQAARWPDVALSVPCFPTLALGYIVTCSVSHALRLHKVVGLVCFE